jgi:FAD/FMN-containing dehydrogenase
MDAGTAGDSASPKSDEKARNGFGENYSRLQKVKKQFDPDNFFNRWFPITPA